MLPTDLSDHLAGLRNAGQLTPAAVLVSLWSYFMERGLTVAEQQMARESVLPHALDPEPSQRSAARSAMDESLEKLRRQVDDPGPFDRAAASWLKGLDRALENQPVTTVGRSAWFTGVDRREYSLHRRNNFIARHFRGRYEEPTSGKHAGLSISAYMDAHVVLPRADRHGITVLWSRSWMNDELRLRLLMASRKPDLAILVWPLRTHLLFQDVFLEERYFRLHEISNEDEVNQELELALERAVEERATVMVLPELCVSERSEEFIKSILASAERPPYPILTLFGRSHRPSRAHDGLWVNEAVLLGPDGAELHVHKKCAPYTYRPRESEDGPTTERNRSEKLELGTSIEVLESPIGNLAPLICLELFHETLLECSALAQPDLVLVPSLSPSTETHLGAARFLQAMGLTSTFVANRTFARQDSPFAAAASFYRVPKRGNAVVIDDGEADGLIFRIP